MTPTKQQHIFIESTISPVVKNILLNAKAGSGKTTTIVMAVKALPSSATILVGCFNKNIRTELHSRLGFMPNVDCRTSHSLGLSMLPRNVRKDETKVNRHFDNMLRESNWAWLHEVDDKENVLKSIRSLATLMRLELASNDSKLQQVCIKHDLVLDANQRAAGRELCKRLYNDVANIDFTDMLFLAATLPSEKLLIKQYDYIFIDEAQDLNAAQWRLYKRALKPGGKLIAVGDKSQAIYGFTGADTDAWDNYAKEAEVLPLSVCWRCSKAVLDYTARVDKEIQAADTAIEGAVFYDQELSMVRPGDAVLCRNVRPLIKGCYSLLAQGKKAIIQGSDIGKKLVDFVKKFEASDLPELNSLMAQRLTNMCDKLQQVYPNLSLDEVLETPSYEYLKDQVDCVNHMIYNVAEVNDIASLCRFITSLFGEQTEGVLFSTVHKAKGLEWPRVFIMEPSLLTQRRKNQQDWQLEQARNLEYVAYTRAQVSLHIMRETRKPKK